jgi:outer membrane autotransporter protein
VLDAGGAAFNAATATTVAGTGTLASTAPGAPIRIAGIVAPDSFRYIADANLTNPGSLAGTEIGTLTLDGNADLSGATIQLRINPAPAASDRLVVLGNLTLNAATTLEITGTIAAATGEYSGPGSAVLISTTGGVSGFNTAKVNVPDSIARAENYLANGVSLDASGLNIVIQTSLAWYATDLAAAPIDRRAHGTFTLADGKTFTVNVPLNDHTNNLSDAWRQQNAAGRVLTKLGTGTLVLARDGGYTGGTTVSEGLLRLTTPAAAGTGAIAVSPGATLELAFSGNFANAVSGNGTINIAAAANVAATATLTGADFANHGAFTGPALDFTALLTNHGTLEAATVGGTTASFVNDSAASVTGNGAYSLAALTNRGSFAASTVNARDSITNHGTFTATDVAGAIVNGDDAATPDAPSAPRFTASGSVTGAILNRGIFRALHVNTPAGFDLATPLILNHGAFDATGGTVTGTIENTGTANVGSVNTPGGGLPATINLVRNTGTFTATTVNGSVLNGLAPNANAANDADADAPANPGATAVFTADAVSGAIENHASFTAAIVNGNVTNTGTFNASNVTGDITNSGTFGDPAATDNSGTTINGLVDNAANGLLNAGVINFPADGLPESRTWLVENHGALTASAVKGALFNAASGEASIGDVDGAVRNAGNIQLRNNAATWGALDNAGGTIRFLDPPQPLVLFDATDGAPPHARAGRTLNIAALTAGNGADRGTYEMSVNISDLAASDRLNVAGEITGAHHFNLTVSTSDPEANLDRAPVVIAIHNSSLRDENVTADVASPYANILHEYAFMSDDNGGYMLAETSKYGPGPTVIGNTIGAMSLSWFAQLNNIERRLGDLRLNAGMIFPIVSRRYTLADANGDEVGGASSARNQNASSGNGDGTDGSGRYNDGRDDVGNNVRTAGLHGVRPPHPLGIWTRAHAQQANVDLGITGMQRFREFQYGVDVGADREFSSGSRHLFYAGAFAGYLGATRDFRDAYGSDGGTDSVAFGVYGAWLHASGLFFEADAKGQYFMTEYNAARDDHAEFESTGAGLSFRLGYRWSLASSFYLEGDIAFSYVHLFNEDFTTANRLRVNVGDSDIRVFGANLRFGKVFDLAHLGFLQPFVKAVIEGQVSNTDGVTIESMRLLRLRPDTDGTRGSVGFGGAWQLDARQQIHFDYEFVWGDKYVKPWTLSLGYRRLF